MELAKFVICRSEDARVGGGGGGGWLEAAYEQVARGMKRARPDRVTDEIIEFAVETYPVLSKLLKSSKWFTLIFMCLQNLQIKTLTV